MNLTPYKHKMGWLPDYPDFRDYSHEHPIISPALLKTKVSALSRENSPVSVDLRPWCSPVEDQGDLGSCTANAGVGMVEYFERRAFGKFLDASRLFLYKVTRNMLHLTGDSGAYIRTTMGALSLFGVPPEEYWPYQTDKFADEPPAFCYAFADKYRTISYFRFDPPNLSTDTLIGQIKSYLASGIPAIFGFTVYSSITQAETDGKIPYPTPGERIVGGHAVMVAGYNDKVKIFNTNQKNNPTTGALLIRNSWGTDWGSSGYGWLPYKYVLDGIAIDWWSLIKNEWVDTGMFAIE